MIIRTVHNKENPYVMLNRQVVNDPKLSLKARGLWATCMSKPNDWHFHVSALVKELKEGKTAVYSALGELIDAGYCIRGQKRDVEGGRFATVEYILYEFPVTEEDRAVLENYFKNKLPYSGFPQADCPHTENAPLPINNPQEIDIDTKHICADAVNASSKDDDLDELGNPIFHLPIRGKLREAYDTLSTDQRRSFHLLMNVTPPRADIQRFEPMTATNVAKNCTLEAVRKAIRFYQQRVAEGFQCQSLGGFIMKCLNEKLEPMPEHHAENKRYWEANKHLYPPGSYDENQRYILIKRIDCELYMGMSPEIFREQFHRNLEKYKEQ